MMIMVLGTSTTMRGGPRANTLSSYSLTSYRSIFTAILSSCFALNIHTSIPNMLVSALKTRHSTLQNQFMNH